MFKLKEKVYREFGIKKGIDFNKSDELLCEEFEIAIEDFEAKVKELKIEYEAEQAIKKTKTEGKLYPSTEYIVSFTKDDTMGMDKAKAAFELGLPETVIKFSNGTKMPIKAEDFPAFAKWFTVERNSFFIRD